MNRPTRVSYALQAGAALAAAALAVGGAALWAQPWDVAAHERYLGALARAAELDAGLNADVARARLGIVTHFDDLVRTLDAVDANRAALEAPPAILAPADRAALDAALATYGERVEAKEAGIERFKSDLAVFRNAVHLLPIAADELGNVALPPDTRRALDHVVGASLKLAIDPEPGRAVQARCALAALGVGAAGDPECPLRPAPVGLGAVPTALLRHAQVVVSGRVGMEERVSALMSLPVADAIHEVSAAYLRGSASAATHRRTLVARVLVAAVATVVLVAAAVIERLVRQGRAVRDANDRLGAALAELEIERDRVLELADLRSRFLAMTSHEFRTPLSLVRSSTDLLRRYAATWPEDRRQRHLGRIREAVDRMTAMLDAVLVLGRGEAGALVAEPRPTRLEALVEAARDTAAAGAGAGRRLELEVEGGDEVILVDDDLLGQVLQNLLGNAFKYSPAESAVRLTARATADALCFEVHDAGIGIPPDDLPRLFQPFHRASNARDFQGTGLGLAIVQRAVAALGGRVDVESAPEAGSTFRVTLPRVAAAHPEETAWTGS